MFRISLIISRLFSTDNIRLLNLDLLALSPPSAGKLERQEWIGLVNWPVATTVAVVSSAIGLISGFLIARKYKATHKTTKKPDGTTSAYFYFGPANGLALEYRDIFHDWNAAVNADTQQDGHVNEGLIAGSQASTNSSLDQMRLSLMQLGDALDKDFGDSFTNGQGNGYANDFGDGFTK
ncbi:hypothetical protein NW760_015430 [Fusarium oxysporum]|nr:hypothetical protein NW769_015396 [Fusarium oxysporum]KAJ4211935.1 hypothetical protein NW760_015430 [Fusarium oxysporum]